jgi:hypothetical protein
MAWNTYAKANFYLDKVGSKVSSGSASGNVVKLQLSSAGGTNSTLDYLEDAHWSYNEATSSLLYGTNTIPALTFADVAIAGPVISVSSLTNLPATAITTTAAALNAALTCTGTNYAVYAYWNTVNGGTNPTLWTNSAHVGSWTNASATNLSYTAAGLAPSTLYYFTFQGTNAAGSLWATNVQSFTTLAAAPPTPVLLGSAIAVSNGVPNFTFGTTAGYKYRLVYKNTLTDVSWLPVLAPPDFPLPDGWSATSTGAPMSLSDTSMSGQPQRFYRLEAANP